MSVFNNLTISFDPLLTYDDDRLRLLRRRSVLTRSIRLLDEFARVESFDSLNARNDDARDAYDVSQLLQSFVRFARNCLGSIAVIAVDDDGDDDVNDNDGDAGDDADVVASDVASVTVGEYLERNELRRELTISVTGAEALTNVSVVVTAVDVGIDVETSSSFNKSIASIIRSYSSGDNASTIDVTSSYVSMLLSLLSTIPDISDWNDAIRKLLFFLCDIVYVVT